MSQSHVEDLEGKSCRKGWVGWVSRTLTRHPQSRGPRWWHTQLLSALTWNTHTNTDTHTHKHKAVLCHNFEKEVKGLKVKKTWCHDRAAWARLLTFWPQMACCLPQPQTRPKQQQPTDMQYFRNVLGALVNICLTTSCGVLDHRLVVRGHRPTVPTDTTQTMAMQYNRKYPTRTHLLVRAYLVDYFPNRHVQSGCHD